MDRSNSEIYNHEVLRATKLADVDLHSRSDSAVVGYLYQKYGDTNELWNSLDGIFACIILDERTGYFCAARDPIGICSLYWGHGADGSVWFASEMKALQTKCTNIECFPPVCNWLLGCYYLRCCRELLPLQPLWKALLTTSNWLMLRLLAGVLQGHVYRSSTGKLERWFKPDWISLENIPKTPVDLPLLKARGRGKRAP